MSKYEGLDQETFDRILVEVIDEENPHASDLLSVPGVAEILMEHYNNAVLERWEESE